MQVSDELEITKQQSKEVYVFAADRAVFSLAFVMLESGLLDESTVFSFHYFIEDTHRSISERPREITFASFSLKQGVVDRKPVVGTHSLGVSDARQE